MILVVFIAGAVVWLKTYQRNSQQPTIEPQSVIDTAVIVSKSGSPAANLTPSQNSALNSGISASNTASATASNTATTTAPAIANNSSVSNKVVDTLKDHKNVLIAIPVQVAAGIALKAAVKSITGKTEMSLAKYTAKIAVNILQKLGVKVGAATLRYLGVKAATTAATTAAKVGTQVATQSEVAASTGPGAPFVEAAMLAFDVLSVGLDIGDAGGYQKMGTKKEYIDMRKGVDAAFTKAMTDQGVALPLITGPLDKMSTNDLTAALQQKTSDILATPANKYMAPCLAALATWLAANQAASSDDVDKWTTAYLVAHPIDTDAVTADAMAQLCISAGGISMNGACSWPTKDKCLSSYSWPLAATDTYAEWVVPAGSTQGQCQVASQAMRGICEQNNLTYNQDTKLCNVTEAYCKTKAAEWSYDGSIKDYDCKVPAGQQIASAIFGTTIVDGLKQVFDPKQYKPCAAGEVDDGYFCRKVACPDGTQEDGGLCYPVCKDGYKGIGPVCWQTCPAGWTDDGVTCRRAGYCAPGKDHQGALCYNQCNSGYTGTLNTCYQSCPAGFRDDGLYCAKPGSYGRGAGAIRIGGCHSDEEKYGGLCYPKCKAGFHAVGCCICSPTCPTGWQDIGVSCKKPSYGRDSGSPDTTITSKDTYGRGVGKVPSVSIHAKQRLVPYSSKNN